MTVRCRMELLQKTPVEGIMVMFIEATRVTFTHTLWRTDGRIDAGGRNAGWRGHTSKTEIK